MPFSLPTKSDEGWIYRNVKFSFPTIFWGSDYIMTSYFHSWQYLVRWWLYRDIKFSPLAIFGEGVIISWHYIFTPDNIWWGGDYIVTLYFHSWQYLVRGDYLMTYFHSWRYLVIISWHYIIIPDTTLESGTGCDYIWIYSNLTLQWYRVLLLISIYSPHETCGGWSDYI